MTYERIAVVVLATFLCLNGVSCDASALPMNGPASAAKQVVTGLQDVRGLCGIYRCPRPHWIRYCWHWRWQPCPPYWGWRRNWW